MREVNQQAMAADFAQHSLNWLVTARFYLEAEREYLESVCGSNSEESARFHDARRRAYDTHAGYRFTYKLRDFAQHGGLPLSGLTIQAGTNGQTDLVPHLRRSTLLTSGFHWGAAVRSLIEASDEVIPFMPLVEQAMEGLNHIEDVVTRIHIERSAGDRQLVLNAIARVRDRDGHPAVFSLPPYGMDGQTAWSTLPTAESIEAVVNRTAGTDRSGPTLFDVPGARLTAKQRDAAKRASAAIAALTAGNVNEHERVVRRITEEDGDGVLLISGLSDMARLLLIIGSAALGSTSMSVLGAVTPN